MLKAADILERDKDKFAHLMTLEMGKPYKAAVAEAVKCTTACRYYAENAEKILSRRSHRNRRQKEFCPLPSHRPHPRRHAVELSLSGR